MTIEGIRPTSFFADDFKPVESNAPVFSGKQEKYNYNLIKATLQASFIQHKNLMARFSVTVKEGEVKEEDSLTSETFNRLVGNISRRGFKVETDLKGSSDYQVKVTLPECDSDETGYVSDGWQDGFTPSILRKNNQEYILNLYQTKAKGVQDAIRKDPDLALYEFSVGSGSQPTVFKWIQEDLQKKGFEAELTEKYLIVRNPLLSTSPAEDKVT